MTAQSRTDLTIRTEADDVQGVRPSTLDERDAAAFFLTFLGRRPNANDDLTRIIEAGFRASVERFASAAEFFKVIDTILESHPYAHQALTQHQLREAARFLARFFDQRAVLDAPTPQRVVTTLLGLEEVRAVLEAKNPGAFVNSQEAARVLNAPSQEPRAVRIDLAGSDGAVFSVLSAAPCAWAFFERTADGAQSTPGAILERRPIAGDGRERISVRFPPRAPDRPNRTDRTYRAGVATARVFQAQARVHNRVFTSTLGVDIRRHAREAAVRWERFVWLMSKGRLSDAQHLAEAAPHDVRLSVAFAELACAWGAMAMARAWLERASAFGGSASVHTLEGRLAWLAGDYDGARAAFRTAEQAGCMWSEGVKLLAEDVGLPSDSPVPARLRRRAHALIATARAGAPLGPAARKLGALTLTTLRFFLDGLAAAGAPPKARAEFLTAARLSPAPSPATLRSMARSATSHAKAGRIMRAVEAMGQPFQPTLRQWLAHLETPQERAFALPVLAEADPSECDTGEVCFAIARSLDFFGRDCWAFFDHARHQTQNTAEVLKWGAETARRRKDFERASDLYTDLLAREGRRIWLLERLMRVEREVLTRKPEHKPDRLNDAAGGVISNRSRHLIARPEDDQARLDLARAFACLERYTEARAILDELVVRVPDHEGARRERLRVAEKTHDPETVLTDATRLTQLIGPNPSAVIAQVKALRALDRAHEAQDVLEGAADLDHSEIVRETVRNLFFAGRFRDVLERATPALAGDAPDPMLVFLVAAAHYELGDARAAAAAVTRLNARQTDPVLERETPLLHYAVHAQAGDHDRAFDALNPLFARLGVRAVGLRSGASPIFDRVEGRGAPLAGDVTGYPPQFGGPLVSVVMTAYNSSKYIRTSLDSILSQSYENLELIVVDDGSSDDTPQILRDYGARDPRVRVIIKSTNDGTYVSKNMGILQARGKYIALQDSDDWSHPDRLAKSIGLLEKRSDVVGLTTDWLRMTTAGDMVIKAGGQISHVCCISIVFRRERALQRLGLFDSVRIEADMEYIRRMACVFGPAAVIRLHWPLMFGRAHSASLTASHDFGITRTGFTKPRRDYQAAYLNWHKTLKHGEPAVMPFPLDKRIFPCPAIMRPDARQQSAAAAETVSR